MNYCLPLSGTFTLLFFRYAIAVLLVGAYFSLRSEWHWPDQRSLLIGFLGHLLWLIAVLKALEFGISAGSAALIAAMQPVFFTARYDADRMASLWRGA